MGQVLVAIVLLAGGALSAQVISDQIAVNRLASSLVAISVSEAPQPSSKQQIVDDIMRLSEEGRSPKLSTVEKLSDALVKVLSGRKLSDRQILPIARGILATMRSAGVAPSRFRESILDTENELVSIGVSKKDARGIADRLWDVGNEVRGPEDVPLAGERLDK